MGCARRFLLSFPFEIAATVLYALLRWRSFVGTPVAAGDTPSYKAVAASPLWSSRFWAGERGPTLPLLYKVVSGDHARIVVQTLVSTVSWVVLAAAVASCIRRPLLRASAFALVLLFSLTDEVLLWDPDLLSESLALSLTALLLAAWLLLVRLPSWWAGAAVLAATVAWMFVRDSNAAAAVVVAPALVVAAALPGRRALKLALLVGTCAVFAGSYASADAGRRWWAPLHDALYLRLARDDPGALRWMERHGLRSFDSDGRRVYTRYLLAHPLDLVGGPFATGRTAAADSSSEPVRAVWAPDVRGYDRERRWYRPILPRALDTAVFLRGLPGLLAAIAVAALVAVAAARRSGWSRLWIVPAVAVASSYSQALVSWHGSGQEVDRHSLVLAVTLRLGLLVLVLFALDAVLAGLSARDTSGVRPRTWPGRPVAGSDDVPVGR